MSATELARALLTRLLAGGVREYVLAPGSRNAPLAFALADAADAGLLRLHTRIDERTAGFLALGLTKVGRRAAVVCTSGTAVANLGWDEVRFPAPIFVGDTLRIETEVLEVRESKSRPHQGIVTFAHRAYNQEGVLVAHCKRASLQRKRPA